MKKWATTPWLGVFIVIVGVSLCAPQVAGALPWRTPVKTAAVVKAPAAAPFKAGVSPVRQGAKHNPDPDEGCVATFTVSGTSASVVTNGKCMEKYLLVSYVAKSAGPFSTSLPQTLFATSTGTSVALPTTGPTCFWQVDYVEQNTDDGAPLPLIDMTHRYGERMVFGMLGGTTCVTSSSTTVPGRTSSSVLGSTIVNTTTIVTDGAEVLGSTTAQALPRTGASHVGFEALMGLALMALGACIVTADRRRRTA
jgi:LPXTG-motif cell wall-anchored protein